MFIVCFIITNNGAFYVFSVLLDEWREMMRNKGKLFFLFSKNKIRLRCSFFYNHRFVHTYISLLSCFCVCFCCTFLLLWLQFFILWLLIVSFLVAYRISYLFSLSPCSVCFPLNTHKKSNENIARGKWWTAKRSVSKVAF